ncbi:MAG TPA: glucose-6-phosphate isomerase [Planctomycetota bacterium]|nr:glucose-6-phosphate isomerase [Planctomycetota bacterium]
MDARLRFDFSGFSSSRVGEEGLHPDEVASFEGRALQELARLADERRAGTHPYLDLPYQDASVDEVLAIAEGVRARFRNFVLLGIGGSALGSRMLHTALRGPNWNLATPKGHPRLFVLDNVDPEHLAEILDLCDPRETFFDVVSKSGGTAETIAQFLLVRDLLERSVGPRHAEHLVVTTDPASGPLRAIAVREGYRTLPAPPGVGGRFSVFSPVGLLSAAATGIDVRACLRGAAAMDARCKVESLERNPALFHASLHYLLLTKRAKTIFVQYVYAERLKDLGEWTRQLIGESVGKPASGGFAGATPVVSIGVTDQHSQQQLYVEGPKDKAFTMIGAERFARDLPIPPRWGDLAEFAYLGGKTFAQLFEAERAGTEFALLEARRPTCRITFPSVSPEAIGEYVHLMEVAVVLLCRFLGVDPFNQPGVESAKDATRALLGREGTEKRRAEIEALAKRESPWRLGGPSGR